MPTLDPRDARVSESVGEHFFKVQRFPLMERIEVFDKLGKQSNAEASYRSARLVPGLMLIEAPVGIARGLPHVQTPRLRASRIV